MELAGLLAEYESTLDSGLDCLTQHELLALGLDMERLTARLDAKKATVLATMKRCLTHRAVKERSGGLALANRLQISAQRGSRELNRADTLVHLLPLVHEAYLAGVLNTEQVDRIIRVTKDASMLDALARDQAMIIGWHNEPFKKFDANIWAWAELNDPTDPQDAAAKAHAKRKFVSAQGLDGVTLVQIDMPNECFAQLRAFIDPIADAMFKDDWEQAKAIHGAMAIPSDLVRSGNQRTFDAFMQLVRQGGAAEQVDPGIKTIVHILVNQDTFDRQLAAQVGELAKPVIEDDITTYRCETIGGHSVSPQFAFDSAIAGEIRRVVLNLENQDITISRKARLFTGLKRHAMIIRDRWCSNPGCATPANRGEADHLHDHASGGDTLVTNGNMKCRPCHRHKTLLQTQGLYQSVNTTGS